MSIKHKLKIAVIGATGYTGLDLVYILCKHPKVKIINLCATKNLNKNISFFDKRIKKKLPKTSSINKINWDDLQDSLKLQRLESSYPSIYPAYLQKHTRGDFSQKAREAITKLKQNQSEQDKAPRNV